MEIGKIWKKVKTLNSRRSVASIISIILILLSLYIFILVVFPLRVINFKGEIQIIGPVEKGKPVQMLLDYCKYADVKPEIEVQIEDGIIVGIPWENIPKLDKGCHTATIEGPVIPERAEIFNNQPKRLRFILTYTVNPLHIVHKEITTETFQIEGMK